jgi:hypothetical protein
VGGGSGNNIAASSEYATIAGGGFSDIGTYSPYAAIGGGNNNLIAAHSGYATVAGGQGNDVGTNSTYSVISGGGDNNVAANSGSATIAGGVNNDIGTDSHFSVIGGGNDNNVAANSQSAAIGGGYNNTIASNAVYGTIPGGRLNSATNHAFAAGNRAKANHTGAFVWADSTEADFASTTNNQFNVRAAGGVRLETGGSGATVDGQRVLSGLVSAGQLGTNSVTQSALADGAVSTAEIADGSIAASDLSPAVLSNTFWRLDGNAGTDPDVHFVGTTDAAALVLRAHNRSALRLEADANGTRLIGGTASTVSARSTNSSILGGRSNVIETAASETTIVGGVQNMIQSNQYSSFIGGGDRNGILPRNWHAVIVGGRDNRIGSNSVITSVLGGAENVVQNNVDGGLIVGGFRNDIRGSLTYSRQIAPLIVGGSDNEIGLSSSWAVVLGGDNNRIGTNCRSAVIAGGIDNLVADNAAYAFVAGRRARASHPGAFVWADRTDADFASTASDQFLIRASGGVGIGTASPGAQLHVATSSGNAIYGNSSNSVASGVYGENSGQGYGLAGRTTGAGTAVLGDNINPAGWAGFFNGNVRVTGTINPPSDRNVKRDFAPVDNRAVLEKLATLPVQTWAYKHAAATRHLGPVAQDFHAAFGLGTDDKSIATVDADGVALAAIQGLNQKLEAENTALKQELAELKALVNTLAEKVNGGGQ